MDLSGQSGQLNQLSQDSFAKLIDGLFEAFIGECDADDLELNVSSDPQHPGNEQTIAKLQSLLPQGELSSQRALLDSLYCVIVHISRSIVKPKLVQKALVESGLDADRTEIFVQLWKNYAPLIVDKLKSRSFKSSSKQLQDVNWKLKIVTESSYDSQQKLPLAQLDLTFDSKNSGLSVNFSHPQLVQFYNNLESIQAKIDKLHQ